LKCLPVAGVFACKRGRNVPVEANHLAR
jgi:hypothetical protein